MESLTGKNKQGLKGFGMPFLAFVILISTAPSAYALLGGDSGGGGGAQWCYISEKESGGSNTRYELLEFWEARYGLRPHGKKLNIVRPEDEKSVSVDAHIKRVMGRLQNWNATMATKVRAALKYIHSHKETRPGLQIQPPTDTVQPYKEQGCQLVGIGNYSDIEDLLSYDKETLEKMPNTDQAGFWIHEAVYLVLRRDEGVSNSVETRAITALLFSDEKLMPVNLKPKGTLKSYLCTRDPQKFNDHTDINGSEFYLHSDGEKITLIPKRFVSAYSKFRDQVTTVPNYYYGQNDIVFLQPQPVSTKKFPALANLLVTGNSKMNLQEYTYAANILSDEVLSREINWKSKYASDGTPKIFFAFRKSNQFYPTYTEDDKGALLLQIDMEFMHVSSSLTDGYNSDRGSDAVKCLPY